MSEARLTLSDFAMRLKRSMHKSGYVEPEPTGSEIAVGCNRSTHCTRTVYRWNTATRRVATEIIIIIHENRSTVDTLEAADGETDLHRVISRNAF